MRKITDINLEEQIDFAFIYNAQMVNFTVVSHNLTFELDFVDSSNLDCYKKEYYSFFNDFTGRIPGVVFNALDHLLDDQINIENYNDIKKHKQAYIWVNFLRFDNFEKINLDKEKKNGNNLMFNIGEYLIYREYKKLSIKLKEKGGKEKVRKI